MMPYPNFNASSQRAKILLAILWFGVPSLGVPAPDNAFSPLDVFDLAWATDPRIAPSGRQIVYVRRGYDVMKDRGTSALWLIDADGDNHEPLTSGDNNASPVWSPDGKRIAYVSSDGERAQIFVMWLDRRRTTAITQLTSPPSSLTWSPDGSAIAFRQFVASKREPIAKLPAKPEGAEWAPEARVYEDSYYRADAGGFLKPGAAHLFMVAATGGKPIQLTRAEYPHNAGLSWSADGSQLYYSSNYSDDWQADIRESDIYAVDVASRRVTKITDRDGPDRAPQVSPDGSRLLYLGSDDKNMYQQTRIYVTEIADHAPRALTESLDRSVMAARWAASGKRIYFSYVDRGVTKLASMDLSGKIRAVAEGLGGAAVGRPYSSGAFSVADDSTVAHDVTGPNQPANLAVTSRGNTRQLTDLNKHLVRYREFGEVEEIWYAATVDDRDIHGWIVKPPGFDPEKKYPLILEIHGGPNTSYGLHFSAELQLYAAAGYVVLYTNPRGSTSYGIDFTHEIHHAYPGEDYDDLMAGIDELIGRGYIDEENLFVTGGSGGGILTAWIVGKTDRFKAAVSAKPVINWYTLTLTSDIGPFFWEINFERLPWQDPAAYLALSPISNVEQVKTPTMLLTGEMDFRTPMSESEQFFQALKMNGVDTALVRIPAASHSITARPSNLIRKVAYVLGWFERYRASD